MYISLDNYCTILRRSYVKLHSKTTYHLSIPALLMEFDGASHSASHLQQTPHNMENSNLEDMFGDHPVTDTGDHPVTDTGGHPVTDKLQLTSADVSRKYVHPRAVLNDASRSSPQHTSPPDYLQPSNTPGANLDLSPLPVESLPKTFCRRSLLCAHTHTSDVYNFFLANTLLAIFQFPALLFPSPEKKKTGLDFTENIRQTSLFDK
ncbi:hypothetical protein BaRGS_00017046 [Batillaria attramentaria]|uniref:Uncharacterized protein n=1 Tax=Batillaria attramentaria TaxID=370345 RepID=A0ABD0KXL8_9CAEN